VRARTGAAQRLPLPLFTDLPRGGLLGNLLGMPNEPGLLEPGPSYRRESFPTKDEHSSRCIFVCSAVKSLPITGLGGSYPPPSNLARRFGGLGLIPRFSYSSAHPRSPRFFVSSTKGSCCVYTTTCQLLDKGPTPPVACSYRTGAELPLFTSCLDEVFSEAQHSPGYIVAIIAPVVAPILSSHLVSFLLRS
jgi:hypothetical protein